MKKTTKRFLGIGTGALVLALLVVMMLGALGTGAWFSDNETSNGNAFTAGSLDLNVDGNNTNVVKFTVTGMRPGNQPTASWTLANVGSVPGYLDLESIIVSNDENGRIEPETEAGDTTDGVGELQDVVNLRLYIDKDKVGGYSTGDIMLYNGPAGDIAGNYNQNELIAAGSDIRLVAVFDWWTTQDDNKAMTDEMTLNMTFELAQTTAQ